jgi:hypothetical protein
MTMAVLLIAGFALSLPRLSMKRAAGRIVRCMPATFPSHAAAALPLKLVRPRWFDGVARWWITATSAVIGGATHVFWDGFTHPPEGGWFVAEFPVMTREAMFGQPWWQIAQWTSTTLGAAAVVLMALHIGRRRLLRVWHGRPPLAPAQPERFWASVAVIGGIGTAVTFVESREVYVVGAQLLLVWSAALAVGGFVSTVRPGERRTIRLRFGVPRKENP